MQPTGNEPVRFTLSDFNQIEKTGVFEQRSERIELIDGELRTMSPATEELDDVISYLNRWSADVAGDRFRIFVQSGLRLLHSDSMPEPDLYWTDLSQGRGRPTSSVVPLVIEVSVSSLQYDLTVKQSLYAVEQIPEYWVVDPISQLLIVHVQPLGQRYSKVDTFAVGQTVTPVCLPGAVLDLHWLFIE